MASHKFGVFIASCWQPHMLPHFTTGTPLDIRRNLWSCCLSVFVLGDIWHCEMVPNGYGGVVPSNKKTSPKNSHSAHCDSVLLRMSSLGSFNRNPKLFEP